MRDASLRASLSIDLFPVRFFLVLVIVLAIVLDSQRYELGARCRHCLPAIFSAETRSRITGLLPVFVRRCERGAPLLTVLVFLVQDIMSFLISQDRGLVFFGRALLLVLLLLLALPLLLVLLL